MVGVVKVQHDLYTMESCPKTIYATVEHCCDIWEHSSPKNVL